MRVVVATTSEDPWARPFWTAYHSAGGVPPSAVFFLSSKQRRSIIRSARDAVFMFGPIGAVRIASQSRETGQVLRRKPEELFPDTQRFERITSLNAPSGQARLEEEAPDLLLSVGAPEIFKAAVLRIPNLGAVNIHNGRLPKYRGLLGTFWEMHCGETWGYATIHRMVPKVDSGGVLAEVPVQLGPSLAHVLHEKKVHGGRLLAWLTQYTAQHGWLPGDRPDDPGQVEAYFGWPSFVELLRYRLRVRTGAPWPKGTAATAPPTWPPELLARTR